ncbi:MAG: hypothetical protein Kow0069_36150 [Promethearchaeota archaeon]
MVTENDDSEKLTAILKILQDFGLNVIQHLGQVKKGLQVLTDKVDSLAKATIELKSLGNRLGEVLRHEERVGEELAFIRRLLLNRGVGPTVGEQAPASQSDDRWSEVFEDIFRLVSETCEPKELHEALISLQRELYELRGPSVILAEIRKTANKLKFVEQMDDGLRASLLEKIRAWRSHL